MSTPKVIRVNGRLYRKKDETMPAKKIRYKGATYIRADDKLEQAKKDLEQIRAGLHAMWKKYQPEPPYRLVEDFRDTDRHMDAVFWGSLSEETETFISSLKGFLKLK